MTIKYYLKQLKKNWLLLVLLPLITGACVYYFAPNQEEMYESNTVVYTGIESGFNISDNVNTGRSSRAINAYSNMLMILNSRELKEEVFVRLLASHLFMKEYDPKVIKEETYARLQSMIPADVRKQLVGTTLEETTQKVREYYKKDTSNPVYRLFHSADPTYSEQAFSTITAKRLAESDLVQIDYVSNDPGACQTTLQLLTNVFINNYKDLFSQQNASVIDYFDEATQQAYARLQLAENRLLEFHKRNNIVDYDQQITATTADKQQALTQLNDLEMQYAGAFTAMKQVEQTLESRGASNLKSQEIISLRNQLSKITSQIAVLESDKDNTSAVNDRLAKLRAESDRISNTIKDRIDNSLPGMSIRNLLDEYLRQTILVEEVKSKLALMRRQKTDLDGEYAKLVPLGAEIRKIRREVEVAEREYFAQVEGLKQSQLTKQNIELTSQVRVVDPPFYPSAPKDVKLLLLVLVGTVGTFIALCAIILALAMMNTTLREPLYAAKVTNFPVFGILPKVTSDNEKQLSEAKRAEEHLARQLLLKFYQKKERKIPYVVGILSGQNGEGKSLVGTSLANKLGGLGIKTLVALPENHMRLVNEHDNTTAYSSLQGVAQSISISELTGTSISDYGIVLIEFPAVLESAYPVSLFQYLDLVLIVAKADRVWEQADKAVFKNIQEIVDAPMEVVLTDVEPEFLPEFVGTRLKKHKKSNAKQLATAERVMLEENLSQEV